MAGVHRQDHWQRLSSAQHHPHGHGPEESVLNEWCQAHEVENLYAVDGSPFPTSTGVNPTLTIMANAWRVAEQVVRQRGPAGRWPRRRGRARPMRFAYHTNTWAGS
ncbi:GMC oxidoreductase [Rubrobacter marinus]|uniref:GMC oxidoreductase n=1 Tax=Rubrobacter marinus TaxID=2653852 RepID=UPI003899F5C5